MEYMTVAEAALIWQLSEQMIRKQCRDGLIPGAIMNGRSWLIPDYAQKHIPDTDREKKEIPKFSDFFVVIPLIKLSILKALLMLFLFRLS